MKKILIACERYSQNLGDGLIFDALQDVLSKELLKVESFDLSQRTSFSLGKNNLKVESKPNIREKLITTLVNIKVIGKYLGYLLWFIFKRKDYILSIEESIKGVDKVLIGGGQIVTDTTLGFMLRIYTLSRVCVNYNIPYSLVGCGVGVKHSFLSRYLYKKVFENAMYLTVRDDLSRRLIGDICKKREDDVLVFNDPVFSLLLDEKIKVCSEERVGINIQDFSELSVNGTTIGPSDYVFFLKRIIELHKVKNRKVYLFTNGSILDEKFMYDNFSDLSSDVEFVERSVYPVDLVNFISGMSLIVSSRMHCGIVSYVMKVPFLQICWDSKIENVWKRFSLDSKLIYLNSINNFNFNKLEYIHNAGEAEKHKAYFLDKIKQMVS
ncbi:polysaccharide pyruvyl transferase family protein [Vibrio parahaemolyticus]|uniref:polysaccharide pyruvyl transferase family protein n=1 Tax=Vibrio parahaemolyticus TaxID=670 RepID=UPI0011242E4F|nr:polysaccharide pyruvyl transferase family protein [Vibrio parahaemolyticus]TOP51136.1 hypothetical protein CGH14_09385 [Vibrio parahaemolyticus]